MGKKALISIITICYNSEKTIKDTIESVLNQTYTNVEYILIDGKSNDSTVDIIKSYEERFIDKGIIYRWISEPDKGIYDAMNKGIDVATGELIGIINSDDWYQLDAIETVAEEYCFNKDVIFHGNINMINGNMIKKLSPKLDYSRLKKTMMIFYPTCFIPTKIYNESGNYDLSYKYASDYAFLLKLYLKGTEFKYLNITISNMRLGGVSDVNSKETLKEARDIRIANNINPILSNIYYIYVYYILRIKNNYLFKYRLK